LLFEETSGRCLDYGHLETMWQNSKDGYRTMLDQPGLAYRCGTFALLNVARALQITNASLETLKDQPSSGPGFSMAQLAGFSQQQGINLVGAVRTNGTNLLTPCVIHWNQNHYAAVITNSGSACWVQDPTAGGGAWINLDVLNAEASGKFLVVSNQLPAGWRLMTQTEMESTWGQGQPNNINDWQDEGCDHSPGGRGTKDKPDCPPCNVQGMARWWVTEPYINLWVADEPLGYYTSYGERFAFRWTYKQRRSLPTAQTQLPTMSARAKYLASWEHNFLSHIQYWDHFFEGQYPNLNGYTNFGSWTVMLFMPGGGVQMFSSNANQTASFESRSRVRVEKIGFLTGAGGLAAWTDLGANSSGYWCPTPTNSYAGWKVIYPDGSQDLYTRTFPLPERGTGPRYTRSEAILTMRVDPQGRTTKLCYENYSRSQAPAVPRFVRIKYVIDSDGRTNTFRYYDGYVQDNNILAPHMVREIEDPYGRIARFVPTFNPLPNDTNSPTTYLTHIIDAQTNSSVFYYNTLRSDGLLTGMLTPYGTTSFAHNEVPVPDPQGTNQGSAGGHDRVNRALTVVDTNAGWQLFMYRYDSPSFLPASFPTAEVPVITNNWFRLDNGITTSTAPNAGLHFRNSFHWGPRAYAARFGSYLPIYANMSSNDFRYARWRHWLDTDAGDVPLISDRVSLERAPTPDGVQEGQKTWFSYGGKSQFSPHRVPNNYPSVRGDESLLGLIAQVLPDGTTRYDEFNYLPPGQFNAASAYPLYTRSTYTMTNGSSGVRTTTYQYHANGIDLFRVIGPDGDIEETYYYNTNHQVITFSNAVAETYSYGYDSVSRNLTSVTNPTGLTITLNYHPTNAPSVFNRNMLASVVEQPVGRVNSFTYTNGLPHVHTNELGLRMVYAWDGLNRPTSVTYLDDGTTVSNRYSKLDLVGRKDRLNNWTLFQYDGAQRLIAVTNANTSVTRLGWCSCGALEGITNALNQATTFTYDFQHRRTGALLADNSAFTYQYDSPGRPSSVTDGAGHALRFAYNNQGLLVAVSNAFGRVLGVVYDKEDRPIQITDADGVTVTNAFDNLNRITNRAWPDGGQERTIYSFAGTNVTTLNPLGHTNRVIFDAALRLLWQTNANAEITKFAYNPAGQITSLTDGKNQTTTWNFDRFGRVTNKIDALAREIFRLTYDPLDRVTNRWTPAKGNLGYGFDPVGNLKSVTYSNASPTVISYAYDAANRLTNMTDTVGSTRFTYTPAGRLDTEDGPWASDNVAYSYIEGQRTSLNLQQPLASAWSQTYGYDAARRLQTLTSPAGTFGHGYGAPNPASALISQLRLPNGALITNAFDVIAQLTNTTLFSQWRAPLDGYGYVYDKRGQRTNQSRRVGTSFTSSHYSYDPIGQLKTANAYESNGTARLHEKLGYAYDAANNLQRRTNGGLTQTFTPDAANQLSASARSGSLTVAGLVTRPASSVTINGQAATLYADQTYASSTGQTLGNGTNTFTVIAQSTTGQWATNILNAYLPESLAFTNDANGNLITVGTGSTPSVIYQYDYENQLTNVYAPTAWRAEFKYDGLNRRRIRKEYTWAGGAWSLTNETRYVYDGMLVLQERDGNNIPVVSYTRGLDLSGSLHGAGGIGGLLALSDERADAGNPENYYYHADGNGNVTALFNSRNEAVARYLYDPYGNLLAKSGPMADFNRYRFSSKEIHAPSGLYYYGFRYYEPNLQRWLNQDPIGERGGINLYRFVRNDPANRIDPLGESDFNRPPAVVISDPGGPPTVRYGPPTPDPRITAGDIDSHTFLEMRDFARDLFSAANQTASNILIPEELREALERLDSPLPPGVSTGYPPAGRPGLKPCPPKATSVRDHVKKTGKPPAGYVGGREFKNREGKLPSGGRYREYDVDPKPPHGRKRNAERIVIDENTGRTWYTDDHYGSFTEVK